MEATLYSLDDALSPATNWVLELQDMKGSLEEAMGVNSTTSDIQTFQNSVGNHFVSTLKGLRKLLVWTLPSIYSMAKVL